MSRKSKITIFVIGCLLICGGTALFLKPNPWEVWFKSKLNKPAREFVVRYLKEIPKPNALQNNALDLGAGVGHESLLLLKAGYQVTAIDNQKVAFDLMLKRPEFADYTNNIKTVVSDFEKIDFSVLPTFNVAVASFTLAFCRPDHFNELWSKIVSKIEKGGYFIGNTFDPGFTTFKESERKNMTFHTKEQTLKLFNDFEIITFNEVKTSDAKSGTSDYYYEVFARKL